MEHAKRGIHWVIEVDLASARAVVFLSLRVRLAETASRLPRVTLTKVCSDMPCMNPGIVSSFSTTAATVIHMG